MRFNDIFRRMYLYAQPSPSITALHAAILFDFVSATVVLGHVITPSE